MLNASGALILRALHHAAAVGLNDKLYVISGFVEGWTPTDEVFHPRFLELCLPRGVAMAQTEPEAA